MMATVQTIPKLHIFASLRLVNHYISCAVTNMAAFYNRRVKEKV